MIEAILGTEVGTRGAEIALNRSIDLSLNRRQRTWKEILKMISAYFGNFSYNSESVQENAPEKRGVYYCCGYINNQTVAHYVGKSYTSIRSRLLNHLNDENWPEVTCFGYRLCDTQEETDKLEAEEIKRLQPKYNSVGKFFIRFS